MNRFVIVFLCTLPSAAPADEAPCPVAGSRIQWQADFCMAQVGTDDVIAAEPCMTEDSQRDYANDCAAKTRYKQEMCRLAITNGVEKRSVAQCLADPSFMGLTVRNDGVGN